MFELTPLAWCGFLFLVYLLLKLVKFLLKVIYTYFIGPVLNKVNFRSKGQWALVTGSTDGIGKKYARQLAARGCDIVLVSRSMDKLKKTAEEIEKSFKVSTKIVQADFSDGEVIYERIGKEIAGLEIGTLVNNVGIFDAHNEYFLGTPNREKFIKDIININMVSVTRMTGLVLPGMVERKKGVIINVSSLFSILPSPLATMYGASKAYVNKFTESLSHEYGKDGIISQCVLPGYVVTNMSSLSRSSFFAPFPKTYVDSALGLVGTASETTGYLPHSLLLRGVRTLIGISKTFTVWLITQDRESKRLRSLKKYKNQ